MTAAVKRFTAAELLEMAKRDAEWRRIEAAAREQVSAEIEADEKRTLAPGEFVAWAIVRYKDVTDDLSEIHRVGNPLNGEPATTCGEKIPAPARRLVLCPGFLTTIRRCRYCEAEYARLTPKAKAA